MSARIRIAIDAMSGDLGPRVAISAAQNFTRLYPDVDVLLFGNEQALSRFASRKQLDKSRITLCHSPDVVGMDDDPVSALRHKKNSSMWQALDNLREGHVNACVSAGNTGALLAISRYLIKTFDGIERPAICKSIPVEHGVTYVLDLGANINCTPEQLHQFALMGHVLATAHSQAPRIALLNIGTEEQKGTATIQAAQQLFQSDKRLNYCGFVEASDIFSSIAEVIVCDGFHGNIALKSSEGIARFIAKKIQKTIRKNAFNRFLGLLIWPLLKQWRTELDPSMYNGASFLGLQKTLIKSHGNANKKAFLQALIVAREQVEKNVPARIQQELLNQTSFINSP